MIRFPAHLNMIGDTDRTDGYRLAITEAVRPGDVVLDIGTGTGILAFFALQAGARRVYAVERGPIVEVAEKAARENGFSDRICFIRGDFFRIEVPERVDVMITETVGAFGFDESIAELLYHGRRRFLKEGGRIVPQALAVRAALVHLHEAAHPFGFLLQPFYGLQTRHMRQLAVHNVYHIAANRFDGIDILSPPKSMLQADFYRCRPLRDPWTMSTTLKTRRSGACHGAVVFPQIVFSAGHRLSICDGRRFRTSHWSLPFFPLGKEIVLDEDAEVAFRLTLSEKNGFVWRFEVQDHGRREVHTHLNLFGLPSLKHLTGGKEGSD